MNIHRTLDKLAMTNASLIMGKYKYFRDSIESKNIQEHLQQTEIEFPKDIDKRFYELKANTLAGELFPAFRIAQWKSDVYPTIIYHHGAAEEPYDYSFKRVLPMDMMRLPVNLIVIRAPYSERIRDFKSGIRKLENYAAMLAVSVKLIEHLIPVVRSIGSPSVTISGLSLGGFVANIHHTFYNSADSYKPCLAGTAIAEALLNSAYSKMVSPLALNNASSVKAVLDFEYAFSQVDNSNVYPILGEYDEIVVMQKQNKYYKEENITVIPKGHVTGSLALRPLRQHILKGLI